MDIIRHDLTSQVLARALDGLSLRAQTIANNIANVDTPGFSASDVTFETNLQAALDRQATGRPLAGGGLAATDMAPRLVPVPGTSLRPDGNNVDIDREMTRLADTQLSFAATTQLLGLKFQRLHQAIWEGRR